MAYGTKCQYPKEVLGNFKKSKWNSDRNKMPRYSVLEVVLENQIDFNNKKRMTENIITQPLSLSQEIQQYLKRVE